MKIFLTIALLIVSNIFMNLAWYGHLKFFGEKNHTSIIVIVLVSWALAFLEYCFQVPANRIGSAETGGPLSLMQLKVLQEVISLITFVLVAVFLFKNMQIGTNQIIAFCLMILAVFFMFKKSNPENLSCRISKILSISEILSGLFDNTEKECFLCKGK